MYRSLVAQAEQHAQEAERLRGELPTLDEQIAVSADLLTSWGLRFDALTRQGTGRSYSEQADFERLRDAIPTQRTFYEDLKRRRALMVTQIAFHRRTALNRCQRADNQ